MIKHSDKLTMRTPTLRHVKILILVCISGLIFSSCEKQVDDFVSAAKRKEIKDKVNLPPDPTALVLTPISTTQINLAWTSGGGSTADYRISYQAGAVAPLTCALGTTISESAITGTAHSVTGLTAGTMYAFRVCSIDNQTTVAVSAGLTGISSTLFSPPPNPSGLAATLAATQINLSWTSGGGSTSGYRIAYQTGAAAPANCSSGTQISAASITGTSHAITGLTANTQYSFLVCAINGNPTPDVSSGVSITRTTLQAAPPNPTGLAAGSIATTQLDLSWTSGGGSTAGYRIAYQSGATAPTDCNSGTQIAPASITGTSHTITGLTAGTQYSFRVCAVNGNPTPDLSSGVTVSATTLQAAPPNPTGPTATPFSTTRIDLSWTSGGGSTADYRISYQSGATAPATCAAGTTISESSVTGTSHSVTGLTANTQYSFRICAINSNGTPDVSSGVTVTATTLVVAPNQPTGLVVFAPGDTQVDLSWSSGGGTTSGYIIAYQSGATAPANCSSGTQIASASITGTSHSVTGLTANTQYSFRVCSVNGNPTPDISAGITGSATTKIIASGLRAIFTSAKPNESTTYSYLTPNSYNGKTILNTGTGAYGIFDPMTGAITALTIPNGRVLDIIYYVSDYNNGVTDLVILEGAITASGMSYLYSYDPLTGLLNELVGINGSFGGGNVDKALFDGYFYIVGNDVNGSYKIYRTDGVGTTDLVYTSLASGVYIALLEGNSTSLFVAYNPVYGNPRQLYKLSPGATSALTLVKNFWNGSCGELASFDFSNSTYWRAVVNDELYFLATTDCVTYNSSLYKSNGTVGNATVVKDPVNIGGSLNYFIQLGNYLLMWEDNQVTAVDGVSGTVTGLGGSNSISPAGKVIGSYYYWAGNSVDGLRFEIWRTNGTIAGTERVDILEDFSSGLHSRLSLETTTTNLPFIELGTDLIYPAVKAGSGAELYKFPLTGGSPSLVKEIGTGASHGVYIGNQSFFGRMSSTQAVFPGSSGDDVELWITDGTNAGTTLVKNINTRNPGSSMPRFFAPLSTGGVLFQAYTSDHGYEYWRSDGTSAGTVEILDSNTSLASSDSWGVSPMVGYQNYSSLPAAYATLGDISLNVYEDPFIGDELYKFDFVAETFSLFTELVPGPTGLLSAQSSQRAFLNGLFILPTSENSHCVTGICLPTRVIASDGTLANTSDMLGGMASDFFNIRLPSAEWGPDKILIPWSEHFDPNLEFMIYTVSTKTLTKIFNACTPPSCGSATGFKVISPTRFLYRDGNGSLFTSDGTQAGTTLLNTGLISEYIDAGVVLGSELLFIGGNNTDGWGLWKTDGVSFQIVKSIVGNIPNGDEGDFMAYSSVFKVGSKVYFQAGLRDTSTAIWVTDGTLAGTTLLQSHNPVTQEFKGFVAVESSSTEDFMYSVGDNNSGNPTAIWKMNGSTGAAVKALDLATDYGNITTNPIEIDGRYILFQPSTTNGVNNKLYSLRLSDNNVQVLHDIATPIDRLCKKGGRYYFTGYDAGHGVEIWRTDGTVANTQRMFDSNVGAGNSSFWDAREMGGKCFFWGKFDSAVNPKLFILDF